MNDIEILNHQIDNIYHAVDRMRTAPRGTLSFSISYIEHELDALREKIRDAFHDMEYEIDCLKNEKENNQCLSNCQ